jgi:hypothetical protein
MPQSLSLEWSGHLVYQRSGVLYGGTKVLEQDSPNVSWAWDLALAPSIEICTHLSSLPRFGWLGGAAQRDRSFCHFL